MISGTSFEEMDGTIIGTINGSRLKPFFERGTGTARELARRRVEPQPVIYLDWTGLDPCSNPVHPNKISFGSWSSTKIQTIQCKIYTKNSRSWHIFGVGM